MHSFELLGDTDARKSEAGLLSPHQFGWPAFRPRRGWVWLLVKMLSLCQGHTNLLNIWKVTIFIQALHSTHQFWDLQAGAKCEQHREAVPPVQYWPGLLFYCHTGWAVILNFSGRHCFNFLFCLQEEIDAERKRQAHRLKKPIDSVFSKLLGGTVWSGCVCVCEWCVWILVAVWVSRFRIQNWLPIQLQEQSLYGWSNTAQANVCASWPS